MCLILNAVKVGWCNDFLPDERPGGASNAVRRFLAATPKDIELVHCPPGAIDLSCDAYVAFLTKRYADAEMEAVLDRPFVSCPFDWWPGEDGGSQWAKPRAERARLAVWMSPLHCERAKRLWKIDDVLREVTLPPPLDPTPYDEARSEVVGRSGTLWAGEWHFAKGPDLAAAWGLRNRERVDFYSPSMGDADRSQPWIFNRFCRPKGFCAEDKWLETFASYERFLHTSRTPDAFGYSIIESYLLGLEVVVSGVTGVESFDMPLDKLVEACSRSADTFWCAVEAALS